MIHEIGVELGAALLAQGCPFKVYDGPESTKTTTYARERIIIEHDEDAGDGFTAPLGQNTNPRRFAVRNIGVKITIYAQLTRAGALPFEHRRRVEQALDLIVVALTEIASERKNGFALTSGKFIQPEDLEGSQVIGGAAYELKFTFDRGVSKRTWAGEKQPEITIGEDGHDITSVTKVSLFDDDGDMRTVPVGAESANGP